MILKKLIKGIISSVLWADTIMDSVYFLDILGINLSTSIKNLLPIVSAVNIEMMCPIMYYLTLPFFFTTIISLIFFVKSITVGSRFFTLSTVYDLITKLIECLRFCIPVIAPFLIVDVLVWLHKTFNKKLSKNNQAKNDDISERNRARAISIN